MRAGSTTGARRARWALALLLAGVAAAAGPALAAPSSAPVPTVAAGGACPMPDALRVRPLGADAVRLSWRLAPAERGASVRVWRGAAIVGQTSARSMVVRVRAGRRVVLAAGVVGTGGAAPTCRARIAWTPRGPRAGARLPAPVGLAAQRRGPRSVSLSWRPVSGARAYRILRDGVVVRQTNKLRFTIRPVTKRPHLFGVAAVDSAGRRGPSSRSVAVRLGHRPPPRPRRPLLTQASDSALKVEWRRGRAGSAPVRGYRVLRDGVIVGQTRVSSFWLTRLYADRGYRIQVASVDSQGYLSAPSPPLRARTTAPARTLGGLRLFVLASTDASFRAFQQNYRQVSAIYPTYFDCNTATGATIGRDDPLITRWAIARGVEVLPRYNCQRTAIVHQLVSDPARRRALVAELAALVESHGYGGINLDLEAGAPADRAGLSALVAELADALHARGARLSVDVSAKTRDVPNHPRSTFFDYVAIGRHADEVIVMSWGLHWSTSGPGPIADIRWFTDVYDYVASLPNAGRFVVGIPGYAFDWPAGGGAAHPAKALGWSELQALIASVGAQPVFDAPSGEWHFSYVDAAGVPHEVWFSTGASLEPRLVLAAARRFAGVALWRAGQEDPALWNSPSIPRAGAAGG